MKRISSAIAIVLILAFSQLATADAVVPIGMTSHFVALTTIPSSAADLYTQDVWLVSIELIPQSTTTPTCTILDKAGTPNTIYNAISLAPNHSYRDDRHFMPLYMAGGIRWSCSDTTVKAQVVVQY